MTRAPKIVGEVNAYEIETEKAVIRVESALVRRAKGAVPMLAITVPVTEAGAESGAQVVTLDPMEGMALCHALLDALLALRGDD